MDILLAVNKLDYIGKDNSLPWYCREDLQHFKKMTLNKKLMVGRTTYENLPPLKNREFIVVGTGYMSLEEALQEECDYLIGGKKLIDSVLENHKSIIDKVHLTIINDYSIGDTKCPDFKDLSITHYHFNC